jgi:hypothetical protein
MGGPLALARIMGIRKAPKRINLYWVLLKRSILAMLRCSDSSPLESEKPVDEDRLFLTAY